MCNQKLTDPSCWPLTFTRLHTNPLHMCYTRINTTNHLHTLDTRDPQMNTLNTHTCIDNIQGHFRYIFHNIIHKSHTTTTTKSIYPVQKEHTHKNTLYSHYTKTTCRHLTHTKHIHFITCYTQTTHTTCMYIHKILYTRFTFHSYYMQRYFIHSSHYT